MAPTLDTKGRWGSQRVKGVNRTRTPLIELAPRESNGYYIAELDYSTKTIAQRADSMSGQLDDLFAHAQVKIAPL